MLLRIYIILIVLTFFVATINAQLASNNVEKTVKDSTLFTYGQTFFLTGDFNKARTIFYQVLANIDTTAQKKEPTASVYNYIGGSYYHQKDFENALRYYGLALKIRKKLDDLKQIANSYSNIGLVYVEKKEYEKALKYHKKSLELYYEKQFDNGIANQLNNIGEVYYCLKEYNKAERYFIRSLKIAEQLNNEDRLLDNYIDLVNNYFAKKQYDRANEYYHSLIKLSKIISRKKSEESARKQVDFNIKKKEHKNMLLLKEIEAQKYKQYGLFGALCFLGILIVLFFLNQKNYKKRKEEEVEKLLNKLKLIKTEALVDKFISSHQKQETPINKLKIEQYCKEKLNETDFKILQAIYLNPIASNKQIAATINLSISGIKSSFTKMYELFNIEDTVRNKKIALAIKITQITQEVE